MKNKLAKLGLGNMLGMLGVVFIALFLSGKIIDIPHGRLREA
jgi:hypothetical protein